MFKTTSLFASLLGVMSFSILNAHHSHGNYEMTQYTEMEGVVLQVLWVNPHTWIYLSVANDDGTSTLWAMEGGGPGGLLRRGWNRDDVEAGDAIKVRCHRLKDTNPQCLLGMVTPEGWTEEKEWD
jgi:hypothetical protein